MFHREVVRVRKSRFKHSLWFSSVAVGLLFCMLLPIAASHAEPSSLHYGNSNLEGNRTVSGAELLSMVYDIVPGETERQYLLTQTQFSFTYSSLIPNGSVSTEYSGEEGRLHVSVLPYCFTAVNGAKVEWIPKTARIGDQVLQLLKNGNGYEGVFEEIFRSEDYEIQIDYQWQVDLPQSICEDLLNSAYRKGNEALVRLLAYEAELAIYREQLAAYEAYSDYVTSVEQYTAYREQMEIYLRLQAEYEIYLEEEAAYQTTLYQYSAWRDYWAYIKAEAEYPERKKAYLEYSAEVKRVQDVLSVLESLFTYDSHSWQHYASLMGTTVTSVIERKAELVTAGCDPVHIETAGNSTEALRRLMSGYAAIRDGTYASEHARYVALYAYYTQHYEEIRDEYQALYGALIALYDNNIVVTALQQEGKLEHFQQFVGQLYVTAVCLDDSQAPSDAWRISKRTLSDVLEPVHMVTDGDYADPATNGVAMPSVEIAAVSEPVPVGKPSFADPGVLPTPPQQVPQPIAPQEVSPPSDAVPPIAEDPGDPPTAPLTDPQEIALADAVRNGSLTERTDAVRKTLTLEQSTLYTVSVQNLMTVTFYDVDGVTVFDKQTVEYGSAVHYAGAYPMRDPSERYYYTEFLGWIEATGEAADLSCVTKSRSVYASYRTEDRYYSIKWIIDGQLPVVTKHLYGSVPSYPNTLTKEADAEYTYVFSGWDRTPEAVCADTVYYGSFTAIPRIYSVTWKVDGVSITEQYGYGEFPQYPGDPPVRQSDSYRYTFSGWRNEKNSMPMTAVTEDVTYYAFFQQTALATDPFGTGMETVWSEEEVTVLASAPTVIYTTALKEAMEQEKDLVIRWDRISLVLDRNAQQILIGSNCKRICLENETGIGVTVYTLRYQTSLGNDLELSVPAELRFDGSVSNCVAANFYRCEETEWKRQEGTVSVIGSQQIEMRLCFPVSILPGADCDIAALPAYAEVGQIIDLSEITCAFGFEVSHARIVGSDGTEIPTDGMCFSMPDQAVSVSLTVSKMIYQVTFLVNGAVYHTAEYGLGESILLPEDPVLPADGQYSYRFLGWSPNVTVAAGSERELVYTAQFSKLALQGTDPYKLSGNSNRLLTVGLPILGAIAVMAIVGWGIRKQKRKQRTDPPTETHTSHTEPTEDIIASLLSDLRDPAPENSGNVPSTETTGAEAEQPTRNDGVPHPTDGADPNE